MAPPPNPGDANNINDDDPLGGMDPMAWLESLAARQGAKPEELTTAANLDIPLPPEGTVIDEPGYTPGYDTGKSKPEAAKAPEPAKAAAPPPEPVAPAPPPAPEPAAASADPFAGMDPMAWLESLAARQGAKPEELTTAANLDIPLPPEGTVIDEPGYTPGYDTGKSKPEAAKAPEPAKAAAPPPEPVAPAPPPAPEPAAASADPFAGMDPMAWLESLAARQGAKPEELTTAANLDIPLPPEGTVIDEPGYTPGYDTGKSKPEAAKAPEPAKAAAPPPEPVAPAPPPPAPEPAAASADPFAGMDPMAWLESLAARQGAKPEELTTAHNLDIPLPPEGTVIDEPGYVDYDPFSATSASRVTEPTKTPEPVAPPPEPEPVPVASIVPDDLLQGKDPLAWLEDLAQQDVGVEEMFAEAISEGGIPEFEEPAIPMSEAEAAELLGVGLTGEPAASTEDLLGGMDPMAWLESLAARQGANLDELVTGGTLDLPPEPSGEADEEYSPFAATTQSADAGMEPESALNWLEALAAEQNATYTIAEPAAAAPVPTPVDEAGGLSNDVGEIQRWLEAQARGLEQTRLEEEDVVAEELAPAEPGGELPDWLRESLPAQPVSGQSTPALSDEIAVPIAPGDLPSWLVSPETEEMPEFSDDLIKAIRETGTMPAIPDVVHEPAVEPALSTDEIVALTQPSSEEEVDSWAEALDEEFERRRAGDETVPDWYLEAMSRAEALVTSENAAVAEASETASPEAEFAPAAEVQPTSEAEPLEASMPDWLSDLAPEAAPAEALPGEIPDWLRSISPEQPTVPTAPVEVVSTSAGSADDNWLSLQDAELPDWLRIEETPAAAAPEPAQPVVQPPAPEPAPVQQVAPPPPPPSVKAPEPAPVPVQKAAPPPPPPPPPVKVPEPVRMREPVRAVPAAASEDHMDRLRKARELVASNQHTESLVHYQTLVDASQLLEETRGDLRQMVDDHPTDPRLRRLLGDTHMRLGDLQDALDTYRSALDQL